MMKEAKYLCECSHTQVIRLFPDEPAPVVLSCVECRAGFGVEYATQVHNQIGMRLQGVRNTHDDEARAKSITKGKDLSLNPARA